MEFGRLQSQSEKLSSLNRLLLGLAGVLLGSNLLLVGLFYWVEVHKQVIVTPAVLNAPFAVSGSSVDASYLQQMALFYVYLRFNVTPDKVVMQESILKQYLAPEAAAGVGVLLDTEAEAVTTNKISSQFYVTDVKVDPAALTVEVSGTLTKEVGSLTLAPEPKKYVLRFSYRYGRLQILDFGELTNETADTTGSTGTTEANNESN